MSEGSTLIYTKKNYYNSSVSGSVLTGNESTTNSIIWSTRSSSNPVASNYFTETQFPLLGAAAPILSATDAYNSLIILKDVGANKYIDDNGDVKTYIDPYDKTKLDNIANDISTTAYRDYSSWVIPTLPENTRGETYDSDGDGMADNWELANSLDPNNANDANADRNGDGYTNLEDFLNQVDF